MEVERMKQIEKLYHAAREKEAAGRSAFLRDACGDDEPLRRRVEALLAAGESDDGFLEVPAFGVGLRVLDQRRAGGSLLGEEIGPYKVLSEIGNGGMGTVYLARDLKLERNVALKALPPSLAEDPGRVERFEQEARLAAKIGHQNVAHVYTIVESGGRHFLAMEYVDGVTLRERLRRGRLAAGEAASIAAQVLAALKAAHAEGIVHRDIKPENIMLGRRGGVKVLDFGLAKLKPKPPAEAHSSDTVSVPHHTRRAQTEAGTWLGTVAYMSPEQVRREEVDERTDIWSTGVVLYEMICGGLPFQGPTVAESFAEILKLDLPATMPGLTGGVEAVVRRALEKDAGRRYQTAAEMEADLLRLTGDADEDSPTTATPRLGRRLLRGFFLVSMALVLAAALLRLARLKAERDVASGSRQAAESRAARPGRVIDLSDRYGRVNMTIFNKKTRVVFANPHEFFQDSGVTSFDLPIKFEEFEDLPPDMRRADGKELTPESRRAIEVQPCAPEVCAP